MPLSLTPLTRLAQSLPPTVTGLHGLPTDIQQALLPFSTLLTEKQLNWTARHADQQLKALEAIDPKTLSQTLLNRLTNLPGMEAIKSVFLAERVHIAHPRLQVWSQQAQKAMLQRSPVEKLRGLTIKVLIDSVNGIVSALTNLGRKLTVIASDMIERAFDQAATRGRRLAERLAGTPEAEAHPVGKQLQAIQIAGEKGKALLKHLRDQLAQSHPQFSDQGIQQAYDDIKRVHEAERRTLTTDDLAFRWLTRRPDGYLKRS